LGPAPGAGHRADPRYEAPPIPGRERRGSRSRIGSGHAAPARRGRTPGCSSRRPLCRYERGRPLTDEAVGAQRRYPLFDKESGARGIRTLVAGYTTSRISRSQESGAEPGTRGHRVFRNPVTEGTTRQQRRTEADRSRFGLWHQRSHQGTDLGPESSGRRVDAIREIPYPIKENGARGIRTLDTGLPGIPHFQSV
jgi:hypothetical protein